MEGVEVFHSVERENAKDTMDIRSSGFRNLTRSFMVWTTFVHLLSQDMLPLLSITQIISTGALLPSDSTASLLMNLHMKGNFCVSFLSS